MKGIFLPAFILLLAAGLLLLYYQYEPKEGSWFPKCPVYATTGLKCPGCGAQRSVHSLLHGNLHNAFGFNPLFIPGMLWVIMVYSIKAFRNRSVKLARWHERLTGTVSHYIWIGILVSYWFLRNILDF